MLLLYRVISFKTFEFIFNHSFLGMQLEVVLQNQEYLSDDS